MVRGLNLISHFISFNLSASKDDKLTKVEMEIADKNFLMPTPREVFTALDKLKNIKYSSFVELNRQRNYRNYNKICLNLGLLIADAAVAIKEEDSKLFKKILPKMMSYSTSLGIANKVRKDIDAIENLILRRKWKKISSRLDILHYKIREILKEYKSGEKVILISLGAWVEGLYILSKSLLHNYSLENAKLLRQPGVIKFFNRELIGGSFKNTNDKVLKLIKSYLPQIGKIIDVKRGVPVSKKAVNSLHLISRKVKKEIVKR